MKKQVYVLLLCVFFLAGCSFNNPFLPTDPLNVIETISINVIFCRTTGVSGSMEPQILTSGVAQSLTINTFTRPGYSFTGWNTSTDGNGTAYVDGEQVVLTESIALFPQWKADERTVTFNANGGIGNMPDQTFVYGKSQKLTKNTFAYFGYSFIGWDTKADGSGTEYRDGELIKNLPDGVTLYAQWTDNPAFYIVEYYMQNIDKTYPVLASSELPLQAGVNGTSVVAPEIEEDGFVFDNLYVGNITTVTLNSGETLMLKLYYRRVVYKVIFNANSGVGSMSPQEFVFEECLTLPSNEFTRTNYTFTGWNTKADGSGESFVVGAEMKILEDTILYAQWKTSNITLIALPGAATYQWSTDQTTQSISVQANVDKTYTCTETFNCFGTGFEETDTKTGWKTEYEPYYSGCDTGSGARKWEKQTNEKPNSGTYCWYFDGATVNKSGEKLKDVGGGLETYLRFLKVENLTFRKGVTYTLSYFAKALATNPAKISAHLAYNGKNVAFGDVKEIAADWTKYTCTFTASEDIIGAEFYMIDENYEVSGNDFWLDDISLTGQSTEIFVVKNGVLQP